MEMIVISIIGSVLKAVWIAGGGAVVGGLVLGKAITRVIASIGGAW